MQDVKTFTLDYICASTASICANFATHPLETIKTRQMLSSSRNSTFWHARHIISNEGTAALYKGITAAQIRAVISGGGRLTFYQLIKLQLQRQGVLSQENTPANITLRGVAATSAAAFAAYLSSPVDLIRTRQAAFKGATTETPSIISISSKMIKDGGVKSLFNGANALMLRAITFNLGQLLSYDISRKKASEMLNLSPDTFLTHLCASLVAGVAATTLSCPAENIKSIQQVAKAGMDTASFRGSVVHLLKEQGVIGFWNGWLPLYLKIAPHTCIVFVVLEQMRYSFGIRHV